MTKAQLDEATLEEASRRLSEIAKKAGVIRGLTVEETAALLSVTSQRVYQLISEGVLDAYQLADVLWLVSPASVVKYAKSPKRRRQSKADPAKVAALLERSRALREKSRALRAKGKALRAKKPL